jgi:hypothetical protein
VSARCPCEGGFCTDPACDWPGRGDRIALIGCSAQKLARPAPARELYTGALFRFSVAYAEKRGLRWVVLSAKHGVVLPDDVIEPYDMTLARWTPPQIMKWGIGVGGDLERRFPGARYVFLAGSMYWVAVSSFARNRVEDPLRGLQIGERLSFLKKASAA